VSKGKVSHVLAEVPQSIVLMARRP
jgi:hypothetical protein